MSTLPYPILTSKITGEHLDQITLTTDSAYADYYEFYRTDDYQDWYKTLLGVAYPPDPTWVDTPPTTGTIYTYTVMAYYNGQTTNSVPIQTRLLPFSIRGKTQVGDDNPIVSKVICLPDEISANSGTDGRFGFLNLTGNAPRTLVALGDNILPQQNALIQQVTPVDTTVLPTFDGYTIYGDQAGYDWPSIVDTGEPGNYLRKYIAGIMLSYTNLTLPSFITALAIRAGVIVTGDSESSTAEIIINGAVVKTIAGGPITTLSMYMDTTYGPLPAEWLGKYCNAVHALDLTINGTTTSLAANYGATIGGQFDAFYTFMNDTMAGAAGQFDLRTGEQNASWTYYGPAVPQNWQLNGHGALVPAAPGLQTVTFTTTVPPMADLDSAFQMEIDFSLLDHNPTNDEFDQTIIGVLMYSGDPVDQIGVRARLSTKNITGTPNKWSISSQATNLASGELLTTEEPDVADMVPFSRNKLRIVVAGNLLSYKVVLNDDVLVTSGTLSEPINHPTSVGFYLLSNYVEDESLPAFKVHRVSASYASTLYPFDGFDTKAAWYVDQNTGQPAGTFMPDAPFSGAPLMMYTNPNRIGHPVTYIPGYPAERQEPFSFKTSLPVSAAATPAYNQADASFYDHVNDTVQLNVNFGGYAPSWTSSDADALPDYQKVIYDLGYKGSAVYGSNPFALDGGVYYSTLNKIDTWSPSSYFTLNDPAVQALYTIPEQGVGKLATSGLRRYPGVVTSSIWSYGGCQIQALNYGHPVWYEQWYSNAYPVPAFTSDVQSGIPPLTVQFQELVGSRPTAWTWDFGDGSDNSLLRNPSHVYTEPGNYTVWLRSSNMYGFADKEVVDYITVYGTPDITDFTASVTSGQTPLSVDFAYTATGGIESVAWDFENNGSTDSTLDSPTHVYSTPGTYAVKLTVTNPVGSDTMIKTGLITVTPPPIPVANFTTNVVSGSVPLTVNFTDTSTLTPTSWAWDFENNGSTDSTVQNPSFVFSTPGTYSVKLTATNGAGSGTITKTALITANAVVPADILAVTDNSSPWMRVYARSSGDTFTKLDDPVDLPSPFVQIDAHQGIATNSTGTDIAIFGPLKVEMFTRSGTTLTRVDPAQITNNGTLPGIGFGGNFSPDGEWFGVGHASAPNFSVYRKNVGPLLWTNIATLGGTFDRDPPAPSSGRGISWTADNQYLAIAHNTSSFISVFKRNGYTFTKLANPVLPAQTAYDCAWNPDGTTLAVAHANSPFIALYNRSGDTLTKLATPADPIPSQGVRIDWNHDGTSLAIVHNLSPYVTVFNRSGDTFTKIANPNVLPAANPTGVAWSNDGKYLAVTNPFGTPTVVIYSRTGNVLTKIANPANLPPDASRGVAFGYGTI